LLRSRTSDRISAWLQASFRLRHQHGLGIDTLFGEPKKAPSTINTRIEAMKTRATLFGGAGVDTSREKTFASICVDSYAGQILSNLFTLRFAGRPGKLMAAGMQLHGIIRNQGFGKQRNRELGQQLATAFRADDRKKNDWLSHECASYVVPSKNNAYFLKTGNKL
jgi:hypothetical protein